MSTPTREIARAAVLTGFVAIVESVLLTGPSRDFSS